MIRGCDKGYHLHSSTVSDVDQYCFADHETWPVGDCKDHLGHGHGHDIRLERRSQCTHFNY